MHVIAYDPYVSELTLSDAGVEPVSFGELLDRSDYISVHAPHNEETEHSFSTDALARMKNTAVIVNTARGPIIDEAALIDALERGVIAVAGLDVLEQEPPDPGNPLFGMELREPDGVTESSPAAMAALSHEPWSEPMRVLP